jgi:hypothetical protein
VAAEARLAEEMGEEGVEKLMFEAKGIFVVTRTRRSRP